MKKFFIKILLLLVVIIVVDFLLGFVLDKMMANQKSELYGEITWVKKNKPDIIVLGTSKASHGYIPEIITKGIDYSCYNLGQDGSNVIATLAIISNILQIYTPKIIIYDLIGQEFDMEMVSSARFKNELPYIKNNEKIIHLIKEEDKYFTLRTLSKLYPYNNRLLPLVTGLFQEYDFVKLYGYKPLYDNKLEDALKTETKYDYRTENENNVLKQAFKELLEEIKDRNIELVLINSPQWFFADGSPKYEFSQSLAAILKQYEINIYEIGTQNYPQLNNKQYYRDMAHLNHEGAMVFSGILNQLLKDKLLNP